MQNGSVTVDPGVEAPLSDDERAARLDALTELIDLIRPAVQADGGDLLLVHADVETGEVEVIDRKSVV